jgi:hypothetical protein
MIFSYSRTKTPPQHPCSGAICTRRLKLLSGAALGILQVGLAPFGLGTLWFTDIEGTAAQVFSFVGIVFCQSDLLDDNDPF